MTRVPTLAEMAAALAPPQFLATLIAIARFPTGQGRGQRRAPTQGIKLNFLSLPIAILRIVRILS